MLLWALAHPRWEFVFQPTYAAYLNLIEPWWKVLRSLALKGRRFATWDEVCQAVADGTRYWDAHRHPFVWGRRPRRRARPAGIARPPLVARTSRTDHLVAPDTTATRSASAPTAVWGTIAGSNG